MRSSFSGVLIALIVDGKRTEVLEGPYVFDDAPCYADAVQQAQWTAELLTKLADWQLGYMIVRCLVIASGGPCSS